jgi:hypothetical protein
MSTQIFVKTLVGTTIIVEIEMDDSVLLMKQKIFDQKNIEVDNQKLIFAGKELLNNQRMSELDIHGTTTFHLIIRRD